MPSYQYDLIVIGGGSAGLVAARLGATLGARTCLIDKERLGGDCLHYGCVPSKSLIHAAKLVKTARAAFSLTDEPEHTGFPPINMAKIAARIQSIITQVGQSELNYIKEVEVKFGRAEFVSPHELRLANELLTARNFIIATGSRPYLPTIEGLAEAGYLTNENVFDLRHLPTLLVIVGGGPVGVELAQAFARLGSTVTLLQGPERILTREDPEVSAAITTALQEDKVKVLTNTRLHRVRRGQSKKIVETRQGDSSIKLETDEILLAVGRVPTFEGLNLEAAGVDYDVTGLKVDEYLRTSTPNIYGAGDVLGGLFFTHLAGYQGGLAARNALLPMGRKKADYRVLPWVTFTDPEAARVGLTEAEAQARYANIKILRFPWHEIDRAQTMGEIAGFIKLVLDEKGEQILGAHLVGAQAGEVLAEITLAMQHNLGLSDIVATIHAYPTLANGLQSATSNFYLESIAAAVARKPRRNGA